MYITFYILVQTHLTLVHLLIIINPILFQKANIILPGTKIEKWRLYMVAIVHFNSFSNYYIDIT